MTKRIASALFATCVLIIGIGGWAVESFATTPPPTYSACVNSGQNQQGLPGALYKVTTNGTPTCYKGDQIITWNQTGPPGSAGAPGVMIGRSGPISMAPASTRFVPASGNGIAVFSTDADDVLPVNLTATSLKVRVLFGSGQTFPLTQTLTVSLMRNDVPTVLSCTFTFSAGSVPPEVPFTCASSSGPVSFLAGDTVALQVDNGPQSVATFSDIEGSIGY